jgi:hypothetical protein
MMPLGGGVDPEFQTGTAAHAQAATDGRHQGTRDAVAWLAFSHLPAALQPFARPFYEAALALLPEIPDSPELTTALNGLVAAKDSAVRAGIKGQTGQAGPVPRPATVVDPPQFQTGEANVDGR